jgi:crotonobetainyl-CoA:carnitine CoA-transferase CaiB-like acyl-CoA transferase
MAGALSHIRVLDLSRVVAAPWASQNLADMGAEVIKVERPGRGDDTRGWGPPFLKDRKGKDTRDAFYYLAVNRGKKSITLDISTSEGQQIVRRLAARCDVVIENYRVGTLKRYGLGYEDMKAINPGLVYCSITGFGQTGPYRHRAGYDFIIQGMSGLMSVTGEREDLPGGGPQKVGVPFADIMTGMYSSIAILAALNYRQISGAGQHIDMALLDAQIAAMGTAHMYYLTSGNVLKSYGNATANIVPYQVFSCLDGGLILAVGNDSQFVKFCTVAGCRELAFDERFVTNAGRVRNRALLIPILEDVFMQRTRADWAEALEEAGVCCGPINDMAEVFEDPQVKHRGMRVDVPHPESGSVSLLASPVRLSETPIEHHIAPPTLGQHTREVLLGLLEMDDDELDQLSSQGII